MAIHFPQVLAILDRSVGGPGADVGWHGAFWRGLSRDEFIQHSVFGLPLVAVGEGAASNLVLALKGQSPFGADTPVQPADAKYRRMPSGFPAVSPEEIRSIEDWIDAGCPGDPQAPVRSDDFCPTSAGPVQTPAPWLRTNAPHASARTDDVCFLDANRGWAVNSNGQILYTTDGFASWTEQFHDEEVWFRCVGFASESRGWVGTLTANKRMYATSDGGATWSEVLNLPTLAPSAICGLSVVDESVVYASGTNFPDRPARMLRTLDGGATWEAWDMSRYADALVDTYFTDANTGWVVGGKAHVANPDRADLHAIVLHTADGGRTWTDKTAALRDELPAGEWGWKIQFLDDGVGYVSLDSDDYGAILKTIDYGETWTRIKVDDSQGNVRLQGVGFIDANTGWVGGWGPGNLTGFSSATTDGGQTWFAANEIGRFINRFRFIGNPAACGYAAGMTVYKYAPEGASSELSRAEPENAQDFGVPFPNPPSTRSLPWVVEIAVPKKARRLGIRVWDRFGASIRHLIDEPEPAVGTRRLTWDGTDDARQTVPIGNYVVRITVDDHSESAIIALEG